MIYAYRQMKRGCLKATLHLEHYLSHKTAHDFLVVVDEYVLQDGLGDAPGSLIDL